MSELLLFSKRFPPCFHLGRLILPLLADDLGYLRVREAGILGDDLCLLVLAIQDESYNELALTDVEDLHASRLDIPFRGLGIFGSGWQIQTCTSPLSELVCVGYASAKLMSLSSASTMVAVRFLVVLLKGGLSSGVNGVLDGSLPEGLEERRCEREDTEDDVRLLEPAVILWLLLRVS